MTERDIFLAALEIPDSAAREEYLDKTCGGNAALRSAVEALFASHEGAGSFLNTPIVQGPGTTSSADTKADDSAAASSAVEQTVQYAPGEAASMNDDDDDADENSLGYLSPSRKADSLGRLGHYEVLEVLGKGAFGTVLKAFDEKLHRMVAIKVMSSELASTSPARKRFLREARASAAIRHDNVVAIYAVEEQPIPYLVMEYIPGRTLQQALINQGPLELNEVLRLGQQIASGLAAAHSQGLIHRDIKPANILLEDGIQWKVKITDFGLARAADDASVTQSGMIAGTPMYMSPEQAYGHNIDQRSDLFSFGSVLYQMASGRPPFRASSTLAVLKRVTEDTPRPIQEIIPEVPDWLCTIISKLHAKKADDRYQTAQEVADLLVRCQTELQHAGKVTCVQSRRLAPRDEPSSAAYPSSSRPSRHHNASQPAIARQSARQQDSSRPTETAAFQRPLLFAAFLAVAAIIAVVLINRENTGPDVAGGNLPLADSASEISNLKSRISKAPGWPSDAPPPAIAPFSAEQAQQHQDAWARYLGVPVEYTNSIGMTFRLIPPGEFMMGSSPEEIESVIAQIPASWGSDWHQAVRGEHPQHRVVLTRPFYLGIHEVSQGQYETITGRNPSHFSPTGGGAEPVVGIDSSRLPVENVTWHDASDFCKKISVYEKIEASDYHYRLPTEAEWEYSCRAGTTTRYSNGNQAASAPLTGWFWPAGDRTHVGGERSANPFGLFDLHGNVWEWVNDNWQVDYYATLGPSPVVDPLGPAVDVAMRSMRGGTYALASHVGRSAHRSVAPSDSGAPDRGFRIALPVDAVKAALKREGPAMPQSQPREPGHTDSASEVSDSTAGWQGWPSDAPKPAIAPFDDTQAKKHQEEWAVYLKVPVDYTNSIGMKFRLIPPGEFMIGSTVAEMDPIVQAIGPGDARWGDCLRSETPRHQVILTRPRYVGIYEVTQAEYEPLMGSNPSRFAKTGAYPEFVEKVRELETSSHPVENVAWNDAVEFCESLNRREKHSSSYRRSEDSVQIVAGDGYRLPTNAEWEFACRGGTTTKYWFGNDEEKLSEVAWFAANADGRTHPVGELKPNPFLLSDMSGNVWEWVQDRWTQNYYSQFVNEPAVDPPGPSSDSAQFVIRGGYCLDPPLSCRSSNRDANVPPDHFGIGFRLSLSVEAVRASLNVDHVPNP